MAQATQRKNVAHSYATSSGEKNALPVNDIRSLFPALQRLHNGLPVAYFDGPGGTQVPQIVVEAMTNYLCHHNANTHWNYPTSEETDAIIAGARETMAEFVGGDPTEIVYGANATTLAFHLSRALGREFSDGDEIVVTELDHHANVGPWQALAHERGCQLRVVRMDPTTGTLDWDDFERYVNNRTKLVAVGAASNALGTINDVTRVTELAHSVGAYAFVDAVHFVPHHLSDVRSIGCDFLICSAYKFYGPHIGVLWCRRELLESLPFAKLQPAPDNAPDRAETGTQSHESIAGAAAAVDFPSSQAARRLAERGVFVSHGDFYAATVIERLGLGVEGLVRAGCACYTSAEEIDRLVKGVRDIAQSSDSRT
jgi:cysteine desulfurase family protein (TIGR01976 family)